jgi:MFS family permease
MAKLIYRPFGLLASVLGGVLAGAIFKQLWKRVSGREDAPKAKESEYGWREILAAAAVQGALFGLVKAAVDRSGAKAFERLTGSWPGD